MLKATKVDGVFSEDPNINPKATFYNSLSFEEAISKNLKVMDTTALTLARDNGMKIKVFNFKKENALLDIVKGEKVISSTTNTAKKYKSNYKIRKNIFQLCFIIIK